MHTHQQPRSFGVTVLGDFILSEGVAPIIRNLRRIGATSVACNPTVTAPADELTGSFQPPADAGSSPRRFDRDLFGQRALWVRSAPSFHPNDDRYADLKYGPRRTNELTDRHGHVIADFISAAHDAGLQVLFQLGAAEPTGLHNDDRPLLPNGERPERRMADTGSLASPEIRAYNRAYVADLLEHYPEIDGFRIDWPENPCYTLGEVFQDFSDRVRRWAEDHGFDFGSLRRSTAELWSKLHGGLTNAHLDELIALIERGDTAEEDRLTGDHSALLGAVINRLPAVQAWLAMKAALSTDLIRDWRELVDASSGGRRRELVAHAFMPPWSHLTGFDFAEAARHCDCVSPKLYTMHWSLMVEFHGRELLTYNPQLNEAKLTRCLTALMNIDDPAVPRTTLADWGYPAPDEDHPIADARQREKIGQVLTDVSHSGTESRAVPIVPLVHGYGPVGDFECRYRLVVDSPVDGLWINRYGYLSDEKLDAIARYPVNSPT